MHKIISGIIILMVLVIMVQVAPAGESGHRKAAEELLTLYDMDEILSQTIDQMLSLEIQQNPQLGLYEEVLKRFFAKYMGWESLKEDFIRMYMDEFTEKELRDMIEFYRTPTGQKAIKKVPVLAAKGAQLGQKRVQSNLEELRAMIEEETLRLRSLQQTNNP